MNAAEYSAAELNALGGDKTPSDYTLSTRNLASEAGRFTPLSAISNTPLCPPHLNVDSKGQPLPIGDPKLDAECQSDEHYPRLKAVLYQWELRYAPTAPSKERAFFSALRTMLKEGLR
eukprot:6487015-Pyramimonas_sp.AAC.1